MLRAGSDGNVCVCGGGGGGGEGGANLPVCRIIKRGTEDVFSWFSSKSDEEEFVQLFPILQVPHAAEQSIPCFLHEQLWEPQSDLPLHLTISNKDACCWWVSSYG